MPQGRWPDHKVRRETSTKWPGHPDRRLTSDLGAQINLVDSVVSDRETRKVRVYVPPPTPRKQRCHVSPPGTALDTWQR